MGIWVMVNSEGCDTGGQRRCLGKLLAGPQDVAGLPADLLTRKGAERQGSETGKGSAEKRSRCTNERWHW